MMPNPTSPAVSEGDSFANIASAPAETIGGIPASNIETCTDSPSNPSILHNINADNGAIINFIKSPIPNGDSAFLSKRRVN